METQLELLRPLILDCGTGPRWGVGPVRSALHSRISRAASTIARTPRSSSSLDAAGRCWVLLTTGGGLVGGTRLEKRRARRGSGASGGSFHLAPPYLSGPRCGSSGGGARGCSEDLGANGLRPLTIVEASAIIAPCDDGSLAIAICSLLGIATAILIAWFGHPQKMTAPPAGPGVYWPGTQGWNSGASGPRIQRREVPSCKNFAGGCN